MSKSNSDKILDLAKIEKKVLNFWEKEKIFDKLQNKSYPKKFIFYEGPPTANGAPGIHHGLARAYKDIITRHRNLKGYWVLRKAGWDTHGLPVEIQVEKQIGVKTKSDIEKFGVAKFNELCKKSVWEFKNLWDKFTKRIGYLLDLNNPYITYENYYIESNWWILKKIWQKNLLYKDFKVVPYCPRCETSLSSHEVAQGYQDVEETSIYLKFRVLNSQFDLPTYFLVWTTTPWTLPANLALAINPEIDYVWAKTENEILVLAKNRLSVLKNNYEIIKEQLGKQLKNLKYEPLYSDLLEQKPINIGNAFKALEAEFATDIEGTGIVHIAPMYGEDDFSLGKKYNLPQYHTVSKNGKFLDFIKNWQAMDIREANPLIIEDLNKRGLLYKTEKIIHTYPFCWRCDTPLLYYAYDSWFIKMSSLRDKLISNNEKINWIPENLKYGRFGEWLKDNKDWNLSRKRYWGTPLPIWKCSNNHELAIGSLKELYDYNYSKTNFYLMRHGEADSNIKGYNSCYPEKKLNNLTLKGEKQVRKTAQELKAKNINFDLIVSSDLLRTKQTAKILKEYFPKTKLIFDKNLREVNFGSLNSKPLKIFQEFYKKIIDPNLKFKTKINPQAESFEEVLKRVTKTIERLVTKYPNKNILIISHGLPLKLLAFKLNGSLDYKQFVSFQEFKTSQVKNYSYANLPKNKNNLDFHKPYIDQITLKCPKCHEKMTRVEDLIDVWFDSGAMPISQMHFPFNYLKEEEDPVKIDYQKLMKKIDYPFPADYISEGIDQTRGWFYSLLAISTLLDLGPSYLNVISFNSVLDENGQKMSKSKGNIVDPWEMIDKYGADSLRWYFYTINNPGEYKKFSQKDLAGAKGEILTLLNILRFFEFYNKSKLDFNKKTTNLSIIEKWINERFKKLVKEVDDNLNNYKVFEAARLIEEFINDFSKWYLRRMRQKFQKPASKKEFENHSIFLAKLLMDFSKLIAPFIPFTAEYLYQELLSFSKNNKGYPQSVHLSQFPKSTSKINSQILDKMQIVREISENVLMLRAQNSLKVRQPLKILEIRFKNKDFFLSKEFLEVLEQELNIKKVKIVSKFSAKQKAVDFTNNDFDLELETYLDETLIQEGIVREIIRNVQELRQKANLTPKDKITLYLNFPKTLDSLKTQKDFFKKETNASQILFTKIKSKYQNPVKLDNGEEILISIK